LPLGSWEIVLSPPHLDLLPWKNAKQQIITKLINSHKVKKENKKNILPKPANQIEEASRQTFPNTFVYEQETIYV